MTTNNEDNIAARHGDDEQRFQYLFENGKQFKEKKLLVEAAEFFEEALKIENISYKQESLRILCYQRLKKIYDEIGTEDSELKKENLIIECVNYSEKRIDLYGELFELPRIYGKLLEEWKQNGAALQLYGCFKEELEIAFGSKAFGYYHELMKITEENLGSEGIYEYQKMFKEENFETWGLESTCKFLEQNFVNFVQERGCIRKDNSPGLLPRMKGYDVNFKMKAEETTAHVEENFKTELKFFFEQESAKNEFPSKAADYFKKFVESAEKKFSQNKPYLKAAGVNDVMKEVFLLLVRYEETKSSIEKLTTEMGDQIQKYDANYSTKRKGTKIEKMVEGIHPSSKETVKVKKLNDDEKSVTKEPEKREEIKKSEIDEMVDEFFNEIGVKEKSGFPKKSPEKPNKISQQLRSSPQTQDPEKNKESTTRY